MRTERNTAPTAIAFEQHICPGCGEDLTANNQGCPHCCYEGPDGGHIASIGTYMASPSYPAKDALIINQVSPRYLRRIAKLAETPPTPNPAAAAVQFALQQGMECSTFLRLWNEGEFDVIRKEWPEAPDAIFIGADPSMTPSANDATRGELTDDEVDALLRTRIPGGSKAADWFIPHDSEKAKANIRYVVRALVTAANASIQEAR